MRSSLKIFRNQIPKIQQRRHDRVLTKARIRTLSPMGMPWFSRLQVADVRSRSRLCENSRRCYDSLAESAGEVMRGFVQGADRQQTTLFPECLDDWVDESNSIRAVDVFVDALELRDLRFDGVDPAVTGRPAYHPSPMLKLYICRRC
jgi:hypothetical protein